MDTKSKTVEMNKGAQKQEPISYEQLEHVARDLNMQCRQMQGRINSMQQIIDNFNEIGMLLSIIDKGENFHSDFVVRCCNRIEKMVNGALDASEQFEKEQEEKRKAAEEEAKKNS
jgi:hypothetical protein